MGKSIVINDSTCSSGASKQYYTDGSSFLGDTDHTLAVVDDVIRKRDNVVAKRVDEDV